MTLSIVPTRASDAHPTALTARGCEASHTRRALLAGAAAAPALALPAVAICEPMTDAAEPDPHPAWAQQAEATATPAVLLADALALHDLLDVPGMCESDAVRSLAEALVAGFLWF